MDYNILAYELYLSLCGGHAWHWAFRENQFFRWNAHCTNFWKFRLLFASINNASSFSSERMLSEMREKIQWIIIPLNFTVYFYMWFIRFENSFITWNMWALGSFWCHIALPVVYHLFLQSQHRTNQCHRRFSQVRPKLYHRLGSFLHLNWTKIIIRNKSHFSYLAFASTIIFCMSTPRDGNSIGKWDSVTSFYLFLLFSSRPNFSLSSMKSQTDPCVQVYKYININISNERS